MAQTSASFNLEEHVLNAGGHPENGTIMTSAGFQVTLDSIGEGAIAPVLSGDTFLLGSGFGGGNRPPGEVTGVTFADIQTLGWNPEPSVGSYNVYRDLISNLGILGFGSCQQAGLGMPTTLDTDSIPPGDGHFFLVTAVNRLDEEGIKGYRGNGVLRQGTTCP